jgi:hypothetical protein
VANYSINIIKLIDIINVGGNANDMPLTVGRWLSNRSLNQQLKGKVPFGEKADVQVIAVFLPQAAWVLVENPAVLRSLHRTRDAAP